MRDGARPDYVIFYDGFNDVYGAYQSGQPGTLHNVAQMRAKLESKPRQLYWQAVKAWFAEDIYLFNKIFCRFFQARELRFREVGAGLSDQDLKNLAAGTVQYYTQSMLLLDHLARAYGFKYACFWRPAIFTEARVLPQETRADVRWRTKNSPASTDSRTSISSCTPRLNTPRVDGGLKREDQAVLYRPGAHDGRGLRHGGRAYETGPPPEIWPGGVNPGGGII